MYSAFAFAFLSAAHSALYCAHDLGSGVGSVSSAFVLLVFWVPVVSDLASLTLRSIEFLSLVEALSVCSCGSDSLAVCTSEPRGGGYGVSLVTRDVESLLISIDICDV